MSTPTRLFAVPALALAAASVLGTAVTASAATTSTSTLTVTLRSDLYAGKGAIAKIGVNGAQVASLTTTTSWRTVKVNLGRQVTSKDEVEVFFGNDASGTVGGGTQDRNLYAKDITVDGSPIGIDSTLYDLGNTWPEATDGRNVTAGGEKLYANGALRFRSGASAISAAGSQPTATPTPTAPTTTSPSATPTAPATTSPSAATSSVRLVDFPTDGTPEGNATQLIQAMDAVAKQGGGTVVLPNQRLAIRPPQATNRIDVPAGVTISGSGTASELALVPNVPWTELFHFSKGHDALTNLKLTRTDVAYGRMLNFEAGYGYALDHVTIDTGHSTWPSDGFSAIQLTPGAGQTISNLSITYSTIQNTRYGLVEPMEASGTVSGVTIDHSRFLNNDSDDLEFNAPAGTAHGVKVTNSTFRDNDSPDIGSGFAIGVANYQDLEIANNTFVNQPMNTIHLEDRTGQVAIHDNTFVTSSTRDTGYASAILILSGTHDVTVSNNRFDLTQQQNVSVPVVIGPGAADAKNPWNVTVTSNSATVKAGVQFVTDYGSANTVVGNNQLIIG